MKSLIIPAIDLMGGECVRLKQGDPSQKTVYSSCPEEIACKWVDQGAERIHIVDLDGAFVGKPKNLGAISRIRESVHVELECGGGLRDEESIRMLLDLGVEYAILGSRACLDIDFLERIMHTHGKRVILGIDARDGKVSTHGWMKTAEITPVDFLNQTMPLGVHTVIYTDISRDGMLTGANTGSLSDLAHGFPTLEFIASGGISSLDDIKELLSQHLPNLRGIITGKALYEGCLSLKEAIDLANSV